MFNPSKQFEQAVLEFTKTLDPTAKVFFNHKVLDRDTGTSRQVDVWIEAKFGGHLPISILVSCKKHKRKLDITHIDTFAAEVRATRASTGVIYSSSGFTNPALQKALSNGLSCCRLFQKEPSEIPKSLVFWHYVCYSRLRLAIPDSEIKSLMDRKIIDWGTLLMIRTCEGNLLVDEIFREFSKGEDWAKQHSNQDCVVPQDWKGEYIVSPLEEPTFKFRLWLIGYWEIYRARLEYYTLNGSYCYTNKSYVGSVATPTVDMWGTHPGPGWEPIKREEIFSSPIQGAFIFSHGNIREPLLEYCKDRPISSPPE
jgi:hypothetical protein